MRLIATAAVDQLLLLLVEGEGEAEAARITFLQEAILPPLSLLQKKAQQARCHAYAAPLQRDLPPPLP